ncbi:MAG: PqqD family protein [Clostridia bacterium]|nr:PqqD family protein [Clostridia bacterium]MBQ4338220.1 PqqD family protein [Clostridia bacterium]
MQKIKDGFMIRKIGGQIMAVPTGARTSDIHGMIALSESGELLWKALENGSDAQALADILTDNYEVDRQTALADIEKFLDGLKEQGALE